MATPTSQRTYYPTTDGRPVAETDLHRALMFHLIATLEWYYAREERVYVSGNLLVFYERGNKRRHISPDVFVVRGVEKKQRDNYLIWEEGKGPECVIELTSSSTRHEDTRRKFDLYQNRLKVREYFLFDPRGDYLTPRFQAYRLRGGLYQPIRAVAGRFPSQVLGLHLEEAGRDLRLFDPSRSSWLPTAEERLAQQSDLLAQKDGRLNEAEAEIERLRRQLDLLRRANGTTR